MVVNERGKGAAAAPLLYTDGLAAPMLGDCFVRW
jgi:hypothetical protein